MKGISVLLLVAMVAVASAQVDECPPEQETNWEIELLLRHEECHKFYKCTFGKPIEYTCYSGLYFNLENWQCDWPHNVDCADRIDPALTTLAPTTLEPTTTTTTTTTPAPTTTSTTTTTTPAPTTTSTTTTTTPAPTTTSTTTTTTTPAPTTTSTTTTTTPAPTTTSTTTTTTPAPTTTSTTTTTTPAPTTTSTTTTTPAPTTTSTSTSTTTHAPECEVVTRPTPQPQPEPQPPVDIDFLENGCPVDPHTHWLLPSEEDCCLFYYCVWGQKVLRECPPTLHFNPILQVCDWPQSAGCSVSVNKHATARRRLLKQILL